MPIDAYGFIYETKYYRSVVKFILINKINKHIPVNTKFKFKILYYLYYYATALIFFIWTRYLNGILNLESISGLVPLPCPFSHWSVMPPNNLESISSLIPQPHPTTRWSVIPPRYRNISFCPNYLTGFPKLRQAGWIIQRRQVHE